jgi:hypothetical protein
MLAELLKKWAELEPGNCKQSDEPHWYLIRFRSEEVFSGELIDSKAPGKYALAYLQSAVQDAIVDRKLRCRIENAAAGWYAKIATTCDESKDALQHHDKECAVALLKAYISYLEGQKAAAPT